MDHNRNRDLDKLRAFAVLFVMIVHFPRLKSMVPVLDPWSGVDLFFVISGFIVAKTFCRKIDENNALYSTTHAKIIYSVSFYIKRFFRLTPPVLAALLFYFAASFVIVGSTFFTSFAWKEEVFAIFTYQYNFFAAFRSESFLTWHWSLSAEEQFYALFPLFIFLIPGDRNRFAIAIFIILFLTFVARPYGLLFINTSPGNMYLPQFRSDGLIYGIIVFLITRRTWNNSINPVFLKKRVSAILSSTLLLGAVALAPKLSFSTNSAIFTIGILSAVLVWISSFDQDYIFPTKISFVESTLNWIGTRSYGIYLLHVPIIRIQNILFEKFSTLFFAIPYFAKFILMIGSLVFFTELMYRLVEMPLQKIGNRIASSFFLRNNNSKHLNDPTVF
jgi:peptidoglycan/LPS O-acetylase OafA/YrhL